MQIPSNEKLAIVAELFTLAAVGWVIYELLGSAGISIAGIALVPTIGCLGIVWLFFALRLVTKLFLLFKGGHADSDTRAHIAADFSDDTPAFDADAALANYMRGREAPTADDQTLPPTPHPGGFGRKVV